MSFEQLPPQGITHRRADKILSAAARSIPRRDRDSINAHDIASISKAK